MLLSTPVSIPCSPMLLFLVAPATAFFALHAPQNADWPRYHGPNGDNRVAGAGLAFDWSKQKPEVAWKAALGPGFGGAAVAGSEVFLIDRDDELEMDVLRVFSLADGSELWSAGYEAKGRLSFDGSRTVPTVLDDFVYTVGGHGHVTCFDRKAHEIAWSVDLQEAFNGELPMFGYSASPLVVGDVVIVTPLGEDIGLLALDRKSGEEAWFTEAVGDSHSSPALLTLFGEPQVVFLSTTYAGSGEDSAAPTTIWSFDPDDGGLLWRAETELTRLPIPPPVPIEGDRLFVTGGYRGGSTLLQLAKKDGKITAETVFRIERGAQIHRPLLHDDHLYLIVNENWNDPRNRRAEGGLLCLSLDGKEKWRTGDAPYFGRGCALLVDDHLVIQDGISGVIRAVRASPDGYKPVGEVDLFGVGDRSDHQMWAPMAFAGGKLLVRSQEELLCVQL